ncbi:MULTISPECIES: helix-turn-helix domain-containing protein [Limnothrix]|uniref:Helix-turn-helix transcriptional regulator n=1 Tax=Limnothrix redekei LRLZ20PSL1 TaxID=3112953 RepID=A0ABW7CD90_9CYAN|nr:helix-turn-helix transcriptional regulator [Limnothrix sp. FACHB-1083]
MSGMGKAGKALRETLQQHNLTQNRLAVTMGIARGTMSHWVAETRDPTAEAIPTIVDALEQLNPEAARTFVEAYLGRAIGELSPKQIEDRS